MLQLDNSRLHVKFEEWEREFGSLYKIRGIGKFLYVLSDYDAIKKIFKGRPDSFKRRSIIEDAAISIGINGIFTSEGETWRQQRKLVTEAFRPENLEDFFPTISRVTARLMQKLAEHEADGSAVDVFHLIDAWALDISALLMFDYDLDRAPATDSPPSRWPPSSRTSAAVSR